jgi:hypothetical protein
MSLQQPTADIDESWDDMDLVPPREPSSHPETEDSDVFDRDTAIPAEPLDALAAQLDSNAVPSKSRPVHVTPREVPGPATARPGADLAESPDDFPDLKLAPITDAPPRRAPGRQREPDLGDRSARTRTTPEPVVERSIERLDARQSNRAPGERPSPSAELDLDLAIDAALDTGASALELVEQYADPPSSLPDEPLHAGGPSPTEGSTGLAGDNEMQDRYAVGDFTGALVVAESILEGDPDNDTAQRYAKSCREVLTQMYAARLGPLDQILTVAVPPDQITWLSLDHRAGFLLSLVDGVSTVEEILDISGMTRLDALRILYTLVQQNVVGLA